MAMLTCGELIGLLDDYRDGRLAPEVRETFDDHLARCPQCAAYVEAYEKTVEQARRAVEIAEGELPDQSPDDLLTAILAGRPPTN